MVVAYPSERDVGLWGRRYAAGRSLALPYGLQNLASGTTRVRVAEVSMPGRPSRALGRLGGRWVRRLRSRLGLGCGGTVLTWDESTAVRVAARRRGDRIPRA